MKKLCIILLLALSCGCAKPALHPSSGEDAAPLAERWQRMLSQGQSKPYLMQLSLRFGTEGDTRRVTAILWGNDENALRLDVQAGVGATVAMALEAGDHFVLYAPRENRAYFHDGSNRPLLRIGVPLPFTLAQLADLLNGHYGGIFGMNYAQVTPEANGLARYTLEGKPGGMLVLDGQGLPMRWQTSGGWQLAIAYDDSTPPLPRTLRLDNPDGRKAILLVKSRENPAPFDSARMDLAVPSGVPMLPLASYKPS